MTTGLHRQVSLKLVAIVREGASRWRLSCGTRSGNFAVLFPAIVFGIGAFVQYFRRNRP
jgi:hypothetical protein